MRLDIVLDDTLVAQALALSSAKTKGELIHTALTEYVARHSRLNIMDLEGQIEFDPDYDDRAFRKGVPT